MTEQGKAPAAGSDLLNTLTDALLRLWRFGHECVDEQFCEMGCPHDEAEAALRAAGRLDEPQVSAAEPPLKALEVPPLPPPSDSKG